jgi:hypothetical protein
MTYTVEDIEDIEDAHFFSERAKMLNCGKAEEVK